MFTFYKNSQKGQDLVEYALMLAIIIGIGWGIYSQTGVADSIKNVFGNASSLMETAKKNTGTVDMKAIIDRIIQKQPDYSRGDMNFTRGLIQSGWLTENDKKDSTIGKLASELDATDHVDVLQREEEWPRKRRPVLDHRKSGLSNIDAEC